MKKILKYFFGSFLFVLLLLLAGKFLLDEKNSFIVKNEPIKEKKETNAPESKLLNQEEETVFEGYFPCPDCDRILTRLTVNLDTEPSFCFLEEEYQNIQEIEDKNQLFQEKVSCELINHQEGGKEEKILRINPEKKEDLREFLFLDDDTLLEINRNWLIYEESSNDNNKEDTNISHQEEEPFYVLKKKTAKTNQQK